MSEKIVGIYTITNLKNNKFYLGSSSDIYKRWQEHINDLNSNRHINSLLQNAWNKYGKENFKFEIIKIIMDNTQLLSEEQIFLDKLTPYNKSVGYNLAINASSPMRGKKHTKEAIKKQIINQSGENHWNYGNHLYKEHKEKISISLGGLSIEQEKILIEECENRNLQIKEICKKYNIAKTTIYRIFKRHNFKPTRKRINHTTLDSGKKTV
jgi:group I intron endonuclease